MNPTKKEHPTEKSDDSVESSTHNKISKVRRELEVISVPSDKELIAEEMEELFEEDQVTHRHGSAEPEGD